jgi:hypothetical protein
VKVCKKNEQTDNKQFCRVQYEGIDPNTGTVLLTAAVEQRRRQGRADPAGRN